MTHVSHFFGCAAPERAGVTRAGTPVTLRRMQNPCALRQRDRAGLERKTLARPGEALPSPWRDPLSREISVETSPGMGASPGLERLGHSWNFLDKYGSSRIFGFANLSNALRLGILGLDLFPFNIFQSCFIFI